jgi:hypothetical protein
MIIEVLVIAVIIGFGFVGLGLFISSKLRGFQGDRQVIQVDLANKQRSIEQLVQSDRARFVHLNKIVSKNSLN